MTTSIFSNSWIGIVFDGRNQQYGAYELRKICERNTVIAILISVTFLSSGMYAILLNNGPKGPIMDGTSGIYEDTVYTFESVIPPPPPPPSERVVPPPPPPSVSTTEFTVPVIVADNLVDTTAIPTQDSLANSEAGNVTKKGDTTGVGPAVVVIDTSGRITVKQKKDPVLIAEVMPKFPGGDKALSKYMSDKIDYPEPARDNGIDGVVYVQFVVDIDGSLTDITVAKGPHKWLNDEGMRVVKSMPKWTPGTQNGEPVRVRFVLPIRFTLE